MFKKMKENYLRNPYRTIINYSCFVFIFAIILGMILKNEELIESSSGIFLISVIILSLIEDIRQITNIKD